MGGSSRGEAIGSLPHFLGYVALSTRLYGWTSRTVVRDRGTEATADNALRMLWPHADDSAAREDAAKLTTEDDELAAKALAHLTEQLGERELSDYEHNLRVILMSGVVKMRTAGIAGSLLAYYRRLVGDEVERKRAAASEWSGTIGKRQRWKLTLVRTTDVQGMYGLLTIHVFNDETGNIAVWRSAPSGLAVGETYEIKGTVKAYQIYREGRQTVLTRCART